MGSSLLSEWPAFDTYGSETITTALFGLPTRHEFRQPHMLNVGSTMKLIIIVLTVSLFIAPLVWAKRLPIPNVEPAIYDGIRYIAPNNDGKRECIQAFDAETGELLKEITLKRNYIWRFWIEADVQLFYITKIEIKDGYLRVIDEKHREFKVKLMKKVNKK